MNKLQGKRHALDDVSKNKIKAVVAYAAKTVALFGASGALMQTFLAMLGFDSSLVYIHSSFLQASNVITMLIASGFAKGERSIKRAAISAMPIGILFLFYLPMAIMRSASAPAYIALVAVGVAQQVFVGLWNVCDYKIPYYVYRADEYGRVLSVCGIVASLFSMLTSSVISSLTVKYDYIEVMTVVFAVCAVLMLVASAFTAMQRNLYGDLREMPDSGKTEEKGEHISPLKLFSNPVFHKLVHANLLRGFSTGVVSVLATVALDIGFNEKLTTKMVPIESVSMLISCTLFGIIATKIPPKYAVLIGSALICILPLMLLNSSSVFLAVYFVIIFGKTLIDYAVPAMLIKVVPIEIAGPYHAWRIALQNAGTLIATSVAAFVPVPVMLMLGAVFQIASGISFFAIGKNSAKSA